MAASHGLDRGARAKRQPALMSAWIAIGLSFALLAGYELWHALSGRRHPQSRARSAHALLRRDWVEALAQQPGAEILAVQTLRNSLMSATISASTAAIALMGTLSLVTTATLGRVPLFGLQQLTPRIALELLLLAALFASYVCSAMAMRYFNHAGFVVSLPPESEARARHAAIATLYVVRAGLLYSWGLRLFLLVAPIVAGLIHPLAMPPATLLFLFVLYQFDRAPKPR